MLNGRSSLLTSRRMNHLGVGLVLVLLVATGAARGEDAKKPRTDLYGDPLPPGAVARLGTIRLRHAGADVAFSKNGKHLISCDNSGTVRVWDVATGKLRKEHRLSWAAKPDLLESAVLLPDGATAAMSDGSTVYLCDTSTGKERGRLPSARLGLRAFSPDSKLLATQTPGKGSEFNIHVWDVAAFKKRQTLKTPPKVALSKAAFSWDGRWMAGIVRRRGGGLGEVWFDLFLWDAASGKLISQQVDLRHLNEDTLTFSPDGKTLAVACRSEVGVHLLEAPTLKQKALLKPPEKVSVLDFAAVAYSPDGRWLAASYSDSQFRSPPSGGVLLWDLDGEKKARRLPARYGSRLAFAPNGETLACEEGAAFRLYDAASGRPLHHRPGHNQAGLALAVSPDGKIVVSCDSYGVLRLWDAATSKQLRRLEGDGLKVAACLFSADGKRLVSVSKADHSLLGMMALVIFDETAAFQVWDVATGKALRRIELRFREDGFLLHAPGISADGRRLATLAGSVDGQSLPPRLIVWDLATGKRRSQRPHKVEMRDSAGDASNRPWIAAHTAFAPDGERVTVWLGDRVGIEEVSTGCPLATLPKGVGRSIVFSPDGRLLAAMIPPVKEDDPVAASVAVRALIEAASGEEIFHLRLNASSKIAFTPNGRGVVVSDHKNLCVWDTATGDKLYQ
ncbi:MAG: WD40 repeat domain-containing protein, partial [Gemmataceae bacterium]